MPSKQEMLLYEYAVIRFIPRVEREEFINVGLIMMCKRKKWIQSKIFINRKKINCLCKDLDLEIISDQLMSFSRITQIDSIQHTTLEAHERFRWATAVRSACITTSRPHPGLTSNLEAEFERLFSELVL